MGNEEDKSRIIKVDDTGRKDYHKEYEPGHVFEQLAAAVEGKKQARHEERAKDERARIEDKAEWRKQIAGSQRPKTPVRLERQEYDPNKMQAERVGKLLAQFEKFEKYKGEDEPKPKARDGLARELDKELEY